jgi:hypothetical protein
MATEPTMFELPTDPDEFGVSLPASNLRNIDFSALDYDTSFRAIVEYLKTYYPDQINDLVASNGTMMLADLLAIATGKLSLRSDLNAREGSLATARTEAAVVNHLALINQRLLRQTPAVVDMEVTVAQPVFSDIEIEPGTKFSISGPDGKQIHYEIYRSPGDWSGKIVIPAGKRGVVAYGLEGQFASPVAITSTGTSAQQVTITDDGILEMPILLTVSAGSVTEEWSVISVPLEKYGPTDKVAEAVFFDNQLVLRFGDNLNGQIPPAGATVTVRYRTGGGTRGRIGVGLIDATSSIQPLPPASAPVSVRFRNISPSSGGTDKESIEQAKRRAPREFSLQRSVTSGEDYANAASNFHHPVFGSVSKAMATLRTSRNANAVELYVLAEGPERRPALPSDGLKLGLTTYLTERNVLTDKVIVLDGAMHPIDVEMDVFVNRNADASTIKAKVEAAVAQFFAIDNWDMGQPFYYSNLVELINQIDGVSYINLHKPSTNVLPTGTINETPVEDGLGYNELITLGTMKIAYYYERNPPPAGLRN